MIAIIQLKKRMAAARVFGIIISKLSYQKELDQMVLFEIDESSEVGFHGTILPFDFAISLCIEDDTKPTLDIKEIAKQ